MKIYEFDFLDSEGLILWNCISKYNSYQDFMVDVIKIKSDCKNNLVIFNFGAEKFDNIDKLLDDTYKEGYEEGYSDGFQDDMAWIRFATSKLIEGGEIKELDILNKIKNIIIKTDWEEREEWLKGENTKIIDELLTEEEYRKKLKEKKKSKLERENI